MKRCGGILPVPGIHDGHDPVEATLWLSLRRWLINTSPMQMRPCSGVCECVHVNVTDRQRPPVAHHYRQHCSACGIAGSAAMRRIQAQIGWRCGATAVEIACGATVTVIGYRQRRWRGNAAIGTYLPRICAAPSSGSLVKNEIHRHARSRSALAWLSHFACW